MCRKLKYYFGKNLTVEIGRLRCQKRTFGGERVGTSKEKNNHNIITTFDILPVIVFLFKFDKRSKTFVVKKNIIRLQSFCCCVGESKKMLNNIGKGISGNRNNINSICFTVGEPSNFASPRLAMPCRVLFLPKQANCLFSKHSELNIDFNFFFSYTLGSKRRLKIFNFTFAENHKTIIGKIHLRISFPFHSISRLRFLSP